MVETATKLPVKNENKSSSSIPWRPFESLRREIDRLFEDFDGGFWHAPARRLFEYPPFGRSELSITTPAVDVAETDKEYEVTAELPGMDEKDIEVKVSNDVLVIRGEKHAEHEEKKKDYYFSERRYGSFERSFGLPSDVDADKIEAAFKKGVLKITLPKSAEAQKNEKKIAVKAA
jgi:HSP20 family protein